MSFRYAPRPTSRGGGRPRDSAREDAILRSVIDLVSEVGYEQTTVEAVARRAGASKATIYRRWRGKRDLVVAAISAHQGGELAPVDTGTLRGDLLVLARRLADTLSTSHGSLIVALLQEAASDPDLCERIEESAGQTGARLPDAVLRRAIGRGDLRETATTYAYDELVGSVLIVRALARYPMDDTYLAYLIDALVLPALRTAADPPPGPALFAGQAVPNHRRTHE